MKSFLWTPPCGVGAIHGYVSLGVTRRKDLPRNSVAELSPWMAQASALEAETSGVIQLFSIWARVIVQSESCRGAGGSSQSTPRAIEVLAAVPLQLPQPLTSVVEYSAANQRLSKNALRRGLS